MIPRTHSEKVLLAALSALQPTAEVLARCDDARQCIALYRGLLLRAAQAIEQGAALFAGMLDEELRHVPDPGRVLRHLDRVIEASFSPASLLADVLRDPAMLRGMSRLLGASEWITDALVRDSGLLRWLLDPREHSDERAAAALDADARGMLQRFGGHERRMQALRRFQRRALLRIATGDVLGVRDLPSVLRELSALADVLCAIVWEEALAHAHARHRIDQSIPAVIIALGKLGGRELNYSSDIDLMVLYDGDHAACAADSAQQLMSTTVSEFVRIMSAGGAEGAMYRVDLRLRPDGRAGALAMPLSAMLAYYESRGADWERQMLLRARVCAGDARLGATALHSLLPFIFPRSMRRLPGDIVRDIRGRLAERWSDERNVKHMRGGIRHIEFAVQALQLIHATEHERLRSASTLRTLDALTDADILAPEQRARLRHAYLFLRRIEHLVQIDQFKQTHRLPEQEAARARMAWLLGFDERAAFEERLAALRAEVASSCDEILDHGHEVHGSAALCYDGFEDAGTARDIVRDLVEGRATRSRDASHRRRLEVVRRQLIEEVLDEPLPLHCLRALEHFLHRADATGAIIALLEHAEVRRMLLRLASLAPAQLRNLEQDPLALELLLTGWDERLPDATLRRVSETAALASYLSGAGTLAQCCEEFTRVAELILRRGMPTDVPMVVVALGKFGGRELIPGSDLDVLFIHDDGIRDDAPQRAAADIIARMQGTVLQPLYVVDARLRPEGRSAPLSVSLSAWRDYLERRASLWEKQSLLRARVAAGDAALGEAVESCIDALHANMEFGDEQRKAIFRMRVSMEPENRFRRNDFIDIKKSAGGLVDAEFAVQVAQLASGNGRAYRVEDEADEALARKLRDMIAGHGWLRVLQLRLRVLLETPSDLFPQEEDKRSVLARSLGLPNGDALLEQVRARMEEMRRAMLEVLG